MKFGIQVRLDEWCTTVWPWPGSKVKVTDPKFAKSPKFKVCLLRQNSPNLIRLMVDYYTTGQYLKFNWSDFWNSSSFFVTWPRNFGPNDVWQVIFLSLCDIYQTWYTGSTRWEMHNGMTLTWIQGQGDRDPKVAKSPKFKVYLLRQNSLNLKTDGRLLHYRTISKI